MRLRGPQTLFGQVLLLQALVMLAAGVALALSLSALLRGTTDAFVLQRLGADGARIESRMAAGARGPALTAALGPLFAPGGSKGFARFDPAGRLVAAGGQPVRWPIPVRPSLEGTFAEAAGRYVLAKRERAGPAAGLLVIEQDRAAPDMLTDDVVRAFLARSGWIVIGIMLLALAAGGLAVHRVIGRVERIARSAEAIGPRRIHARVDPAGAPEEMLPLLHAVNRALERLAEGYREQAGFLRNVSHELRSPLAILALRARDIDDAELRATIERTVTRASHVIGQLMELAGLEALAPSPERFDLVETIRRVVEERAVLAIEAGQTIAFDIACERIPVDGHPGLIAIVAENLVGNAIRHNPPGTAIRVTVGPDPAFAVIDNGAGIGAAARQRLKRNVEGGGLGLMLCERIVALHGGRFEIGDARPRGTRAAVILASELDPDTRHHAVAGHI